MPNFLGLRNGFAWWLPPVMAALGAAIAVLVSQTVASAWDADVHLWAREGPTASEYAEILFDPSVQDAATSTMMATEAGPPQLEDVAVELTDTLIRVTVRSAREADAEALAVSLAHAAVNEAYIRYGEDAGLDVLGLVRPGARKVAPPTEWAAAWASAIGLIGGLTLAFALAKRTSGPASTLGRLGRLGFRPLAVISPAAERAAEAAAAQPSGAPVGPTQERGTAADDAVLLANAINPVSGLLALVPLDEASRVTATLIQTARTLAARGRPVIWLDGRRPAFELAYSAPPDWMSGVPWSPVNRSQLILRAATRAKRPNGYVMLLTDSLDDKTTLNVVESASGVVLLARSDAAEEELVRARLMMGSAQLLGVALTQAQTPDLREFELAQMTD